MVFPLYNEEIHILGRKGITDFDDLADRRVAIGREGSGTYLTARILLKMADVTPRETVLIDTDEALAELKAGRIDAMFYVAGYPVKLFTEKVAEADGLGLVPDPEQDRPRVLRAERDPGEDVRAGSPTRSRPPRSRRCWCRSTSGGPTATTWAGSPRPSRRTWTGSSPTAIRSGSRSISSTRCGAGNNTTASASTWASPPARATERQASTNPVMDAIKEALGN